jgi:hypothetical protein
VSLKAHGRRHGQVSWYRQLINQKGEKVQEGTLVTLVIRSTPLTTRPVRADAAHRVVDAHISADLLATDAQVSGS